MNGTNPAPRDPHDPTLRAEHDANYIDYWMLYRNVPGSESRLDADTAWLMTSVPVSLFNGVYRAPAEATAVAELAAEITSRAAARGVPFRWNTCLTTPPETVAVLTTAGWTLDNTNPVMVFPPVAPGADATLPPGVTIETVDDDESFVAWSRIVALGFGFPADSVEPAHTLDRLLGLPGETPFVRYLARVDGEPAATSALLPTGTLGGIYSVATLPEFRGRGLGGAVTMHVVHAANAIDASMAVLQASKMGEPVYARLGFTTIGLTAGYIPPPA
jgi:ribosomal protein S18 acetylase RimI-like enzyme